MAVTMIVEMQQLEGYGWILRLEAMATLKMSECVPPLAMQDKA